MSENQLKIFKDKYKIKGNHCIYIKKEIQHEGIKKIEIIKMKLQKNEIKAKFLKSMRILTKKNETI